MAEPVAAREQGREEYYRRLEGLHAVPLWRRAEVAQREPRSPAVPHVWRWSELYPMLLEAAQFDLGSEIDRRVLSLRNPGIAQGAGSTPTLSAALQMILPGETAPSHRHTMAAIRWIIEGRGAYTVVEGERIPMEAGDLILTPQWTWHDHGHEGDGPMLWLDGLDAPFVRTMGSIFVEDHPERVQPVGEPAGAWQRFATGGVLPLERPRTAHSPLLLYRYEQAYEGLRRLAHLGHANPFDDVLLEYVNPITGGHVLPTMACYLQLLRPGTHTQAHRHVASTVYHVVRGAGATIVDGQRLEWQERDTIALPSWTWHEHVNASRDEEAVLFSFSDAPIFEAFGLNRQEALAGNGSRRS